MPQCTITLGKYLIPEEIKKLRKALPYNLPLGQHQLGYNNPMTMSIYFTVMNSDLEETVENLEFD